MTWLRLFLALSISLSAGAVEKLDPCAAGFLVVKPDCKVGQCPFNVGRLLAAIGLEHPDFDASKAKVLIVLERRAGSDDYPDAIAMLGVKDEGTEVASYHMVLEYQGKIFDTSDVGAEGIPREEYFRKKFVLPPGTAFAVDSRASPPLQERYRRRVERTAFGTEGQAHAGLEVLSIDPKHYMEKIYPELLKIEGRGPYWFYDQLIHRQRGVPLYSYLGKPEPREIKVPLKPRHVHKTFGKRNVSYDENVLEEGDLQQKANAVHVSGMSPFNRIDRSLEDLKTFFSPKLLNENNLKGKVVVDVAGGGGLAMEELREKGIATYVVEIALNQRQRQYLLADTSTLTGNTITLNAEVGPKKMFIEGDSTNTHIADKQVDVLYESYGIFNYEFFAKGKEAVREAFTEWKRILKIGGVIRCGPIDRVYEKDVREFVKTIPGLEVTAYENSPANTGGFCMVEITRRE